MLAFYNGGTGAGASQSWRHLQCIETDPMYGSPIEEWVRDLQVERKDKPFVNDKVPHLHLMHHLPPARQTLPQQWDDKALERMETTLANAFTSLLDTMYDALRRNDASKDGGWNLLMTLDHLHLIPRSKPNYPLPGTSSAGSTLEVNSIAFAGMLLVKSEQELAQLEEHVKKDDENKDVDGLWKVLYHCGVPRSWSEWEEPVEGPLAEPSL